MAMFKLPLSGDVVQSINPFTSWFSPSGGQFGLINISLGQSSAPAVEQEVLEEVGSYGKQLGKIGDALIVLLRHMPKAALTDDDQKAVGDAADDARGESPTSSSATYRKASVRRSHVRAADQRSTRSRTGPRSPRFDPPPIRSFRGAP